MKALAFICTASLLPAGLSAQSHFEVSAEDLQICGTLSNFNREIASRRDAGATRDTLSRLFPDDFEDAAREDMLEIVEKLVPGDPGFAAKVTGAICLLERLQPREVN